MSDQVVNTLSSATHKDDGYEGFVELCKENFQAVQQKEILFKVNLSDLIEQSEEGSSIWYNWVNRLPEEFRQHYNCQTCKRFFNEYGNLVYITSEDEVEVISAIMPAKGEDVPFVFREAYNWLTEAVKTATVTDVFYRKEAQDLGVARSKPSENNPEGWTHFSVHYNPEQVAYKLKGETHQYHGIVGKLQGDIHEVSESSWNNLKLAIDAGKFDDYQQHLSFFKWLLYVKDICSLRSVGKVNLLWLEIVKGGIAWVNFKSTVVGEFLKNCGEDVDVAYLQYLAMTDPLKYQRAQKDASDNQLKIAAKRIEELGVNDSLLRRPAKLDELHYIWESPFNTVESTEVTGEEETPTTNVFNAMLSKKEVTKEPKLEDTIEVSWTKFYNHVLPKAKRLRVYIPGNVLIGGYGFMGPVVPDSKPIFKWDKPEKRYPFNQFTYEDHVPTANWFDKENLNDWFDIYGVVRQSQRFDQPLDFLSEDTTNQMAFFIIKGMGLLGKKQSALFANDLYPEFHEIRRAIEMYSQAPNADWGDKRGEHACGIEAFTDAKLEVTMESGKAYYSITSA